MDLVNFYDGIKQLSDWFGKKLSVEQQDLMLNKVKHIPNEAFTEIVGNYVESLKAMPSNFPNPGDIKNQYWQWRQQHPEKVAAYPRTDCPDCMGKGFLWASNRFESGVRYEFLYRCAACKNWRRHLPEHTLVLMESRARLEKNFERVWPDLSRYRHLPKKTTLTDMVNSVGEDVKNYGGQNV